MTALKDGATSLIATAPSPATSGTSLVVTTAEGALFPAPPFYAIAHPANTLPIPSVSEKVLVTAVSTDTLTIVRAQGGYSAKSIAVGWRLSNALFTADLFTSSINAPEVLGGTPNGATTTFTTSQAFTQLWLFKDGVYMQPGVGKDYTYSGTIVTFASAPASLAKLVAIGIVGSALMISGSASIMPQETPTGSVNGSNTVFTTSQAFITSSTQVYINGIRQKLGTHYTETTSTTITMSEAPLTGDDIMITYQYVTSTSGNADTVDGIHANTSPTAGQLYPLVAPTTDANGWTVYDFGTFKEYVKSVTITAATVASLTPFASPTTITLPSGTTRTTVKLIAAINVTSAYVYMHAEVYDDGSNWVGRGRNLTTGSQTPGNLSFMITFRDV